MVLLALFGAVMGQGVIWYTGQFYAQNFLETKCNLEFEQSRVIMLWAIAFATPFFLFFGWLSDRIGRKWIMLTGMLLGVLLYRPIFAEFLYDTSTKVLTSKPILETKDISDNKVEKNMAVITLKQKVTTTDGFEYTKQRTDTVLAGLSFVLEAPKSSPTILTNKKLGSSSFYKFIFLVWVMIVLVTMVYGPIAAFLVEMFPTKIRYTSMSLPYHIGNGVFGGLVPFIGLLITTTYPTDPLAGLWYPIGVAALCFVIGAIYLSNKIDKDVND